ncbi:hypothetical protein J3Q64DRAFT_1396737 [Phycomyces blakesleeanus]|uniref:Uncharacterized protein n=2 Tax=Phycomyces blakesleeanus TaxID=4837 RepID=A0A163A009_PHYB8|nr:hypothetical protein PHYBLDRAFT_60040 [Phycomyces blakesleeanus NRRL 1555(-)]OAD70141.1 hypothetical protein PHYBLDRAFT_60040 [Phycomyces blakesleeanus NRRL 1555(-)]|eukprot:XP_018288181.1 hypothetical protein PHYBLDRAFT_60040 [Phycomyces blakesleeanus NRRL 1555(-)]
MYKHHIYTVFAKKYRIDPPFPISLESLVKYLKFKRKTNKQKSLKWHLSGLANHPLHDEVWKKNVLQHPTIENMLAEYKKTDEKLVKKKSSRNIITSTSTEQIEVEVKKEEEEEEEIVDDEKEEDKDKVDREGGGGYRAVYDNESADRVVKVPRAKGFMVIDSDSNSDKPENDVLKLSKRSEPIIPLKTLRQHKFVVLIKK